MGEALMKIVAILKQMEVDILRERTNEGIKSARARGKNGGRPVGSYNKTKAGAAAHRYTQGIAIKTICKELEARTFGSNKFLPRGLRQGC